MEDSCRLCLKEVEQFTDVFEFKDGHRITDMIELICTIKIEKNDFYSKQICLNCLDVVYKAYELRILSNKNDRLLKAQCEASDNSFVKIEENVEDLIKYEPSPSPSLEDKDSVRDYDDGSYDIVEISMQPVFSEDIDYSYECDRCSEKSSSKETLELHIKKEHLLLNICTLCSKKFSSAVILKQHMHRKHSSGESLACDKCELTFKSPKKLQLHEELHSFFYVRTDDGMAQCRLCAKLFKYSDKRISAHVHHHKKKGPAKAKDTKISPIGKRIARDDYESLVCPHCGQIYRTKQILHQHIKRHFDTGDKYACPKCPQKFKSWGELYYHNAVHTTERNFVCEICSKAFKAKRDLRNHKIRHETKDVKRFQCSYCQLMLKSKYTLNRHILIHTGEKKFQCTYCLKAFTQKNELNKHLRIHIGECTYKCDNRGCTEAFRLLAELRLHQQVHYASTTSEN